MPDALVHTLTVSVQRIQNAQLTKAFQNVSFTTQKLTNTLKFFQGYQYTLLNVLATFMITTIHSVITAYCFNIIYNVVKLQQSLNEESLLSHDN